MGVVNVVDRFRTVDHFIRALFGQFWDIQSGRGRRSGTIQLVVVKDFVGARQRSVGFFIKIFGSLGVC